MIVTAAGADVYFSEGTEVMVIKCLDDKVYANINDKLYNIREIENWEEYSENFDVRPELKKEKKKYIPLVDHPWRQNSWKLYSSSIRAHFMVLIIKKIRTFSNLLDMVKSLSISDSEDPNKIYY